MVKRGGVYWAALDPVVGHEQAGMRPVLVLSEDRFNARTRTAIVVALTTKDKWLPPLQLDLGHVAGNRSYALPGQVRTLSVKRLNLKALGSVSGEKVEACLDAMLQLCGRSTVQARKADNDG